jgi:Tol biopolymer transport system component
VCDTAGKRSFELVPSPHGRLPSGYPPARLSHLSADGTRAALFRGYDDPDRRAGGAKSDQAAYPPPDVTVWDAPSQKVLFYRAFPRTDAAGLFTRLVAFSPDGTILALVERVGDGEQPKSKLTLIDIAAGGAGKTVEVPGAIGLASFSPDGKRIQCGMGTPSGAKIMIFDTAMGNRVCTIEGEALAWFAQRDPGESPVLPKGWSPDGTRLAVAEPSAARIHLFDTTTGKLVKTLDVPSRGGFIPPGATPAFSPDGRRIAVVVRLRQRGVAASTVTVLDTDSGKELLPLPLPGRNSGPSVGPVRFSPDGHRLLHFALEATTSREPGGATVKKSSVRVTTWDATPLPEPKQP